MQLIQVLAFIFLVLMKFFKLKLHTYMFNPNFYSQAYSCYKHIKDGIKINFNKNVDIKNTLRWIK